MLLLFSNLLSTGTARAQAQFVEVWATQAGLAAAQAHYVEVWATQAGSVQAGVQYIEVWSTLDAYVAPAATACMLLGL